MSVAKFGKKTVAGYGNSQIENERQYLLRRLASCNRTLAKLEKNVEFVFECRRLLLEAERLLSVSPTPAAKPH